MATAVGERPLPTVPDHVPPELVEWFDFRGDAGFHADPHGRLEELRARRRVFFTPFSRGLTGLGTWVFTSGEDVRAILQDPETFASGGLRPFARAIGDDWTLIPIDLDPPDHARYRALLNPLFSPARMKLLEEVVNARAADLIAPLAGRSGCEFVEAFARPFPVTIFLELMGLPLEQMGRFIGIEEALLHGTPERQLAGIRDLRDYLAGQITRRRGEPGDDLISHVLAKEVDGRPLSDGEAMGISFMLFLGGLDTVTSTLGYVFRYLADHPEQQQRLRDDPDLIPDATEELLRIYNVVTTGRHATRDVEFGGVHIKAGDNLALPTTFASRDPAEFASPGEVDFTRTPNRHSAFGLGIHRCLGSHLARREIASALREWTQRMPIFRLAEGATLESSGSGVVALKALELAWD